MIELNNIKWFSLNRLKLCEDNFFIEESLIDPRILKEETLKLYLTNILL